MKCARLKCPNTAQRGKRGFCDSHWLALPDAGYVDAAEASEHINRLKSSGWTYRSIANESGMSADGIRLLAIGEWANVSKRTFASVMAIPLTDGVADKGAQRLPNVGVRRRIEALAAAGYSQSQLADELGVTLQCVNYWHRTPRVSAATVAKIAALFERLQMIPGPSVRTRTLATSRCWVPPLAWDEDAIDDPDAMPDARVNVYASSRRLRALCRMGFSQKYMSERLDIPTDKTSEILRFLGPIDYSLADAIEKLFNELRGTPKDDERLTSRRAAQARSVTARYGWAFPDDLGDVFKKPSKQEIESMNRSNNERADTAKKMFSEGVSKSEIARQLNVNPTTVYAWLREAA